MPDYCTCPEIVEQIFLNRNRPDNSLPLSLQQFALTTGLLHSYWENLGYRIPIFPSRKILPNGITGDGDWDPAEENYFSNPILVICGYQASSLWIDTVPAQRPRELWFKAFINQKQKRNADRIDLWFDGFKSEPTGAFYCKLRKAVSSSIF